MSQIQQEYTKKSKIVRQSINTSSILVLATASLLVTGCAFGSKPNVKEPTELVKLNQSTQVLQPVFKSGVNNGGLRKSDPLRMHVEYDGQHVFFASRKGDVKAMTVSGKKRWVVNIDDEITGGVAYDKASNTLVVTTREGKVVALDSNNGNIRWVQQLSGTVLAPAVISQGRIMLSSNDGFLHGLNLLDGDAVWKFVTQVPDISVRGTAMPTLVNESTVLFPTADGRIHMLDTETGKPIWSRSIGIASGVSNVERMNDVDATAVVDAGYLYIVSYSGELVGINLTSRKVEFYKKIASLKQPAVTQDLVIITSLEGKVIAFNRSTGELQWENTDLLYRGVTNPVAVSNYIVVGDYKGVLHLLDKSTGQIVNRSEGKGALNHLQVIGNRLISQNNAGDVMIWQW